MADCNTCSQYMSTEDILRRSIKCDANGNVALNGGLLNVLPDWALTPYFAIPENGVTLMVGQEVTIYGDDIVNTIVPIPQDFTIEYTTPIGTVSGNNLVINPIASEIGSHVLVITAKYKTIVIETYTINLFVYAAPKAVIGAKKILFIGDSLTNGGITYFAAKINELLPNLTLTYLGTQGTTVKHEGRSGWAFYSFVNTGSPFVKSGSLNIPAYFTDNSIATPDIVYIALGINDTFDQCNLTGDGLTDTETTAIINIAKTLIDGFLAYNASLKIILGIPTLTENTGAGWNANYDELVYSQNLFIQNLHKYRVALVTAFAGGAYNIRVDCSYEAILIDRNEGYPKTGGIHTNGVHPDQSGYEQLGIGKAFLSANIIPDASSSFDTDGTGYWGVAEAVLSYNTLGFMTITVDNKPGFTAAIFKGSILTPTKKYRWSMSIKSASYTGRIAVNFGNALSTPIYRNPTTEWVTYSGYSTCGASNVLAILFADAINGTVDFDNIIIQEVESF